MKKFILTAISVLVVAFGASAQPRALGLRVGGDAEASYQHSFGDNFLEADLGLAFAHPGLQVTGIFDFVFASVDNFNFYAGPGAQINVWSKSASERSAGIGVGGQIGAEYRFGIPFNISLDWRPMWNFIGQYASWSSVAIGFRYRF